MKYIQNGKEIKWLDEDPSPPPKVSRISTTYYRSCQYGELKLAIGDFVLISDLSAGDEDNIDGCEIAEIVHLYDTGDPDEEDPCWLTVQWFTRWSALPAAARRSLPAGVPPPGPTEVVLDTRPFSPQALISTVWGKCEVRVLGEAEDPASAAPSGSAPLFVTRFILKHKPKLQLLPIGGGQGEATEAAGDGRTPRGKGSDTPTARQRARSQPPGNTPAAGGRRRSTGREKGAASTPSSRQPSPERGLSRSGRRRKERSYRDLLEGKTSWTDDDSVTVSHISPNKMILTLSRVSNGGIQGMMEDEDDSKKKKTTPKRKKTPNRKSEKSESLTSNSKRATPSSAKKTPRPSRENTPGRTSKRTTPHPTPESSARSKRNTPRSRGTSPGREASRPTPESSARAKRDTPRSRGTSPGREASRPTPENSARSKRAAPRSRGTSPRRDTCSTTPSSGGRGRSRPTTPTSAGRVSPRRGTPRSAQSRPLSRAPSLATVAEERSPGVALGSPGIAVRSPTRPPVRRLFGEEGTDGAKRRRLFVASDSEDEEEGEENLRRSERASGGGSRYTENSSGDTPGENECNRTPTESKEPKSPRRSERRCASVPRYTAESFPMSPVKRKEAPASPRKHHFSRYTQDSSSEDERKRSPHKLKEPLSPRRQEKRSDIAPQYTEESSDASSEEKYEYKGTPTKRKKATTPRRREKRSVSVPLSAVKSSEQKQKKTPATSRGGGRRHGGRDTDYTEGEDSSSDEERERTPAKRPGRAAPSPATPSLGLGRSRGKAGRSTTASPRTPKTLVPTRPAGHLDTPGTPLERARSRLHVAAVPDALPCRENEFFDIYTFVEARLLDGTGGCMYVSGVPGTGKTATMREVVRSLRENVESELLPDFQFIEVNGMRLTEPSRAYCQILSELTGTKATPDHAAEMLDRRFAQPAGRRQPVLLLVDELDLLWTRKQSVLYNLFDWPSRPHARLVVVAIANTMDLPERIMMNRVSSRLGLTRMTFQPYTFPQLQEIVSSRLRGLDAFDPDAVQLVARKVAAVSGDARRALDICRRATELAERDPADGRRCLSPRKAKAATVLVTMQHVNGAIQEMFSSPKIMAIRSCPLQARWLLQAMVAEFQRTGLEEARLGRVYEQMEAQCRFEGVSPPTLSGAVSLVYQLAAMRLVHAQHGRHGLETRLRLNISVDDVSYAVQEYVPEE